MLSSLSLSLADVVAVLRDVQLAQESMSPSVSEDIAAVAEGDDTVSNLSEHMANAQLSDRNSAANSTTTSPAIGSEQSRERVPSVDLKDGGTSEGTTTASTASAASNASAASVASAASTAGDVKTADADNFDESMPGGRPGFFDVRIAVVGNVDSGKC